MSPVEVIVPANDGFRFLGSETKKANTELLHQISVSEVHSDVCDFARKVFVALGARDFARIDIMMDKNGSLHFIEANLVPGMMRGTSYFPQSCAIESGMHYDDAVGLMIQGAVARRHATSLTVSADGWSPEFGPPDRRKV